MGELERKLRNMSRSLKELARKLDQAAARAGRDRDEGKRAKRKRSKKREIRKSGPEIIMDMIKARKKGVDTGMLRAKTGFGSQKVRSIVWGLSKKGKIQRVDRGLYRAVK